MGKKKGESRKKMREWPKGRGGKERREREGG